MLRQVGHFYVATTSEWCGAIRCNIAKFCLHSNPFGSIMEITSTFQVTKIVGQSAAEQH